MAIGDLQMDLGVVMMAIALHFQTLQVVIMDNLHFLPLVTTPALDTSVMDINKTSSVALDLVDLGALLEAGED